LVVKFFSKAMFSSTQFFIEKKVYFRLFQAILGGIHKSIQLSQNEHKN